MIYLIFISLLYINIEMSSSNQRLDLRTSLQGSSSFLQIESVNSNNFNFDANSTLNLADSLTVQNITVNGTFTNAGGGEIGGSTASYTTSVTTPKIVFTDNLAEGFILESSDGGDYIVCNSTNGSEQINLKKKVFTDGNQIVLGSNLSRGILQYGNIKNSTIDATNTLSANTTGTSASWASARTVTFRNSANSNATMGSVAIQGTGDVNADIDITCDKRISNGCSKRRPDILVDLGYQVVIIEVDENQHVEYECSCENKRLMEIYLDIGKRPIIFIRFNPDDYNQNGKKITSCWGVDGNGFACVKKNKQKEWIQRLDLLKTTLEYWINQKNITNKTIETIQLYYDN
jgi:hypothetical protein